MIIYNEPLSVYEVFWHLYLATIESPTDILPLLFEAQVNAQSLAAKVFRSLEKKGEYPLHPYGDDYCLSMPEDGDEFDMKKEDLVDQLTFKLWRSQPDGDFEQLLETLLNVAELLASTEVEYKPPIKAFIVASGIIYVIRQGYIVKENNYSITESLEDNCYMPKDWLEYEFRSLERSGRIRHALVTAIADGYFGGNTSIQVY